jgi:hypothetical protein
MKKVLKSFSTAHEAVNWVSKNRLNGASIETTSTLKSFGYGRIPSGNYHVIKATYDDGAEGTPMSEFVFNNQKDVMGDFNKARLSYYDATHPDGKGGGEPRLDVLQDIAREFGEKHGLHPDTLMHFVDRDPRALVGEEDLHDVSQQLHADDARRTKMSSVNLENIVRETVKSVLKSMGY